MHSASNSGWGALLRRGPRRLAKEDRYSVNSSLRVRQRCISWTIGAIAVLLLARVDAERGGLLPVASIEAEAVIGYASTRLPAEVALGKTDLGVEILTGQQIRAC
ncbi:hypothetical protein M8I34_19555 [Streptomyces sp. MCA2]|uniref:hypothetical protein n=1 Tax=Streptomyces sp. MCA2 TaxID=2944805 RepID=UPI002021AFFF|nr:hypothetical protein [Streptomyces sp. MCA2]MCL7493582.1 hypothetical protein [Streptomyces sp. MCA2]